MHCIFWIVLVTNKKKIQDSRRFLTTQNRLWLISPDSTRSSSTRLPFYKYRIRPPSALTLSLSTYYPNNYPWRLLLWYSSFSLWFPSPTPLSTQLPLPPPRLPPLHHHPLHRNKHTSQSHHRNNNHSTLQPPHHRNNNHTSHPHHHRNNHLMIRTSCRTKRSTLALRF